MCDFKPGDEVTLATPGEGKLAVFGFVYGAVYTVTDVLPPLLSGSYGLRFAEIDDRLINPRVGFDHREFRKVQRRDLTAWLATENTIEGPARAPAKKRERV